MMMEIEIFFVATLFLNFSFSYDPAVQMPYKEILGSSSDINIIGNTIQCTDMRENIKTCAEDCFAMENQGNSCVGFLVNSTVCSLCVNLNQADVNTGLSARFTTEDRLYLLTTPNIDPNIYISMDDFDLDAETITGIGVTGTSSGITRGDLISDGKVGQAIYVHNGGRMFLNVGEPECFATLTIVMGLYQFLSGSNHLEQVVACKVSSGLIK